jgi:hypothetical protein
LTTKKLPATDGRRNNGKNLKGRPKGVKNKTTLFKEIIRNGFEEEMIKDFSKVYKSVVNKAIEGDMTAAKLLFDRALPTSKAIDLEQLEKANGVSISVNIGALESPEAIEAEVIEVVEE